MKNGFQETFYYNFSFQLSLEIRKGRVDKWIYTETDSVDKTVANGMFTWELDEEINSLTNELLLLSN